MWYLYFLYIYTYNIRTSSEEQSRKRKCDVYFGNIKSLAWVSFWLSQISEITFPAVKCNRDEFFLTLRSAVYYVFYKKILKCLFGKLAEKFCFCFLFSKLTKIIPLKDRELTFSLSHFYRSTERVRIPITWIYISFHGIIYILKALI